MSMTYMWNQAYRGYKGNPEEVGQELEKILEEHGNISAQSVLDTAKNKESILHDYFEWDDSKAAEQYRLEQARYLVRMLVFKIEDNGNEPKETRAFVEIRGSEGPYTSLKVVVEDESLMTSLMKQALHDIEVFEHKYTVLTEVIKLLGPVKQKLTDTM